MRRRILKTSALLYFPLLLFTLIWAHFQRQEQISSISSVQKKYIQTKAFHLEDLCQNLINNTLFWTEIDYPEGFWSTSRQQAFFEPFLGVAEGIPDFDQLRFLSFNGDEMFRYERDENGKLVQGTVQNKAHRPYFQQGIRLKPGEIYLSPIELNMENGMLEQPYKPVIRSVAPIVDRRGSPIALVVINFKMNRIFERLNASITADHFFLVDRDLKIISSNISPKFLAHQSGLEQEDSLVQKRLDLKGLLFRQDTTFTENGSLWVYQKVPLSFEDTIGKEIFQAKKIINDNQWAIIDEIPAKNLDQTLAPIYRNMILFNVLTLGLVSIIALGYARHQRERIGFIQGLKNQNIALEESEKKLREFNRSVKIANKKLNLRNTQLASFNYVVAHNLKAPVSSMSMIMDLLKGPNGKKSFEELVPKLEVISKNISTLTEDIGKYVTIINKRNLPLTNTNILVMLKQLESEFEGSLAVDGRPPFQITHKMDQWHTVKCYPFYMQSILHNLISNAIRYRRSDITSYIHFEAAMENDQKVLYIRDNGLGINLERHGDSLFKLYKRFHRELSGKGVGLFMVKSQVEAMNATIEVDSKEGYGTTFKIKFNNL